MKPYTVFEYKHRQNYSTTEKIKYTLEKVFSKRYTKITVRT